MATTATETNVTETTSEQITPLPHLEPREVINGNWSRPSDLLERRRHSRFPMAGKITLYRQGEDPAAYRNPIWPLQIQDISATGLGGECEARLELDEPVLVFITSDGMDPRFERRGRIVRCQPISESDVASLYSIGVEFDMPDEPLA